MPNNSATSTLKNFQKTIDITMELLENVAPNHFYSPYSVVPIISQILGLNTPLMGTGDSPYSITSLIFDLNHQEDLFAAAFRIPLQEKRMIIDEIYEMIAPALLGEEEHYISLVCQVKGALGRTLKEKFAALAPLIKKYHLKKGDFGYIVHYGYLQDLNREYDFLAQLPVAKAKRWRQNSYPVVNEIIIRNFPVSTPEIKRNISGWIIFVSNHTKELLEDGKLRKHKILQAARLAEKLGAKLIGMGGLIASFAQGGYWLSEQIPQAGFTTGHAYTIGNIINILDGISKKVSLNLQKSTIAIVGAAGSIGSGSAKLLAKENPQSIILADLNFFSAQEKLEELKKYIGEVNPKINVVVTVNLENIKKANLVVIATNSPSSIIKPQYLKKGAIVIDDSFPKNISPELLKRRKDIIALEGGITQLPVSIDVYSARNMPDLMDAPLTRAVSCKETYGCFAETLVLAAHSCQRNYGLGYADPLLAADIRQKAQKLNFTRAPFQCFDEAVEEERMATVKNIIDKR